VNLRRGFKKENTSLRPAAPLLIAAFVLPVIGPAAPRKPDSRQADARVTIHFSPGQPANVFSPDEALGAGVDGHEKGEIDKIYTAANIRAMRSAGLHPLTYRLRTELGIEAWHWNPRGRWSDPTRRQGYWTSDPTSSRPILTCYGFRLPRRGSTTDQANNDGYSRIDDGDARTFWKSNPYLDAFYTGEDNAKHPQWFVIDLAKVQPLDTIRIRWGVPWATRFSVEYWNGPDAIYINENAPGRWETFPDGAFKAGKGGESLVRLSPTPLKARFVRVVMTESSGAAPRGATDVRDRLGYAVREVELGATDGRGRFHDVVKHGRSNKTQTLIYASSTDPWHRASDIDHNVEQPGYDRVFRSGLTNGLPCLIPVGLLYDTPENGVNALRFLKSRGYRVDSVEMGEEPDGQYITPEDYAAFYVRWARAIRQLDPNLKLGGPCFQTTVTDVAAWPDHRGNRSWMARFLDYLKEHGRSKDYQFFSFEWYPFDDTCAKPAPQLARAPALLSGVLTRLQNAGLSRDIPWMITEYGYSAFAGQAEVDVPGALLNADIVGQFLTLGGDRAYLYGYEPNTLIKELTTCDAWGNLALFLADDDRRIRCPLPTYYAAKLCAEEWVEPGSGRHEVWPATCGIVNPKGEPLVTAYALKRPDGRWSLMMINKDPERSYTIQPIIGENEAGREIPGPVDLIQYGAQQYAWKPQGEEGHPLRNLPPARTRLPDAGRITLPPYSISILRVSP